MHFIADELKKRGPTRMFSFGFSIMAKLRGRDPRLGLESRANRVEPYEGVECYLWRTQLHPVNPRWSILQAFSPLLFESYRRSSPALLERWVNEATTVIVESGIGVLLIEDIRRWNPRVEIIYIASDDLETIGVDPYLQKVFQRVAPLINSIILPSKKLARCIPPGPACHYVPHGIDFDLSNHSDPSPYGDGIHAVSVGSMLFDCHFFEIATSAFPTIMFHVIGAGVPRTELPPSVFAYDEMPFRETLPFIKHAQFGIAPYRRANVPYYLCDTSMKLMQYEYFGVPAVCPTFARGDEHPLNSATTPMMLHP